MSATDPGWALQKAIFTALAGDAALTGLIGPDAVHDGPPLNARPPYVVLGEIRRRDWSSLGTDGAEHEITLRAYSRYAGSKEASAVANAVEGVLHDADLLLEGHMLVNLQRETAELRATAARDGHVATLRFRAVTETL